MKRATQSFVIDHLQFGEYGFQQTKDTPMTPSSNSPRCGLAAWPALGIVRQMTEIYSAANGTSSLLTDFKWRFEKNKKKIKTTTTLFIHY